MSNKPDLPITALLYDDKGFCTSVWGYWFTSIVSVETYQKPPLTNAMVIGGKLSGVWKSWFMDLSQDGLGMVRYQPAPVFADLLEIDKSLNRLWLDWFLNLQAVDEVTAAEEFDPIKREVEAEEPIPPLLAPAAPSIAANSGGGINATEAAAGVDVVVGITGTGARYGDGITVNWGNQRVSAVLIPVDISANSVTVLIPSAIIAAQGDGTFNVTAFLTDLFNVDSIYSAATSVLVNTIGASLLITDDETGTATGGGGSVLFYFVFSEAVTGFAFGDIQVTGGTAGTFTQISDSYYTLDVTPNDNSTTNLVVSVAAGVAINSIGNGNTAAQAMQAVNTTWVTLSITDDEAGTANIPGGDVTFTLTFGEAVTGFALGDIQVTGGTVVTFHQIDTTSYGLVVTPAADSTTNLVVSVAAGVAVNSLGNNNAAASDTQPVNTVRPTIAIAATLAGNNIVDASEDQALVVSGTSGGAVGQTVTIGLNDGTNSTSTTATVAGDGSWAATSVDITNWVIGNINITADVTNTAGNPAVQATKIITLDNPLAAVQFYPQVVGFASSNDETTNFSSSYGGYTCNSVVRRQFFPRGTNDYTYTEYSTSTVFGETFITGNQSYSRNGTTDEVYSGYCLLIAAYPSVANARLYIDNKIQYWDKVSWSFSIPAGGLSHYRDFTYQTFMRTAGGTITQVNSVTISERVDLIISYYKTDTSIHYGTVTPP